MGSLHSPESPITTSIGGGLHKKALPRMLYSHSQVDLQSVLASLPLIPKILLASAWAFHSSRL